MILADTSIWIDYFRKGDAELSRQLDATKIAIHPFIVIELMLGPMPNRRETMAYLDMLPKASVANEIEVRSMIYAHSLVQRGIGFVDAHLLASALLSPHTTLWSRDKRLRNVARELGVEADLT